MKLSGGEMKKGSAGWLCITMSHFAKFDQLRCVRCIATSQLMWGGAITIFAFSP